MNKIVKINKNINSPCLWKGFYECIHITKKSIPFKEYKKRSRNFDKITDGKTIAEVEEMVREFDFSIIRFAFFDFVSINLWVWYI